MLTLGKTHDTTIACVPTTDKPSDELLGKEWLLTNRYGSYASSTIVGCNTRRYHGLLIGSPNPLCNRIMALANCLEMLVLNKPGSSNGPPNSDGREVFELSTFEFNDKFAPEGFRHMRQFRRDSGVHFDFDIERLRLTKSIYLLGESDTVALVYDFGGISRAKKIQELESVDLVVRPMVGLRDFHGLQKSYARMYAELFGESLVVRHKTPSSCELVLSSKSMKFSDDPQWWFNFSYRWDKERGQQFNEDLWSPGFFRCRVDSDSTVVLWASLTHDAFGKSKTAQYVPASVEYDIDEVRQELKQRDESLKSKALSLKPEVHNAILGVPHTSRRVFGRGLVSSLVAGNGGNQHGAYEILCLVAEQFIARRRINGGGEGDYRTTILAGFPWFADWGRDAFISLPGLLLLTGKFDEARSVLTTFARAADKGMIPNRFDDYSDTAYFNSIDASLWFISSAFQYLHATGDMKVFTQHLLPTIRWIVDSYNAGTRFGIRADDDGLITGGNDDTQLTWMDAKCDDVAFTGRWGKAVEVNALWYNSLCYLAQFYAGRDREAAQKYKIMSDKVGSSFSAMFWNEQVGYLNDRVLPDGSVDAALRPNQIFAVSLAFSALPPRQAKCVVDAVEKHLLTPYGLRTLNTEDSHYKGRYEGHQRQRDEAYHQGTVWPYLMGPFVEAYLKVNGFDRKSRKKASEFIQPLMRHLTEEGCIGQVAEIFDGDAPHRPRGCFAQAWSVAELIKAYRLING